MLARPHLPQLALRTHGEGEAGRVVGFDLQPSALEATRARLQKLLTQEEASAVLHPPSHASSALCPAVVSGVQSSHTAAGASSPQLRRVELYQKSHSLLSEHVSPGTVKLVAFNTGYLPGAPPS